MGLRSRAAAVAVAAAVLGACLTAPALARPLRGASAPDGRADSRLGLERVLSAGAPGALAEVRDRDGVADAAVGVDDRATRRSMSVRDHFRVGSVTKAFVAVVLLQLAEERRLRLDDPIARYLPGLLRNGDRVTLRQLAHMTSGVYDYINDLPADTPAEFRRNRQRTFAPRELTAIANGHPSVFAPGRQWGYSNTNFIALGLVIEHVTGRPLAAEIRRRIVVPLRLRGTFLPSESAWIPAPYTHGYHPNGASSDLFDSTAHNPTVWWATGALISTAHDLNAFFAALMSGRLLDADSMRQMRAMTETGWPVVPAYGLGLIRRDLSCGVRVWGHSGIVEGYTTLSFATADGGKQVTVAANTSSNTAVFNAMLAVLTQAYCGASAPAPSVAPHDLARYRP